MGLSRSTATVRRRTNSLSSLYKLLDMHDPTRIFVAGHLGMVGSAIVRQLSKQVYVTLLLAPRSELDLTDGVVVQVYMQLHKPDQVYFVAAKVGGIHANNTYPAEFIANNLDVQSNAIQTAYSAGFKSYCF